MRWHKFYTTFSVNEFNIKEQNQECKIKNATPVNTDRRKCESVELPYTFSAFTPSLRVWKTILYVCVSHSDLNLSIPNSNYLILAYKLELLKYCVHMTGTRRLTGNTKTVVKA